MRKWLAIGLGTALIVLTGTALALTVPERTTASVDSVHPEGPASPEDTAFDAIVDSGAKPSAKEGPGEDKTPEEPREKDPDKEKPDDETAPPSIAILHPVEGQVFTQKEVVFRGTTDPGARVFAGKWEADVDSEGNWKIVLFLSPGSNKATLKAIDAAGNASSASVRVTFEAPKKEDPKPKDKGGNDKGEPGWKFSANQVFGESSANPPFDIFRGTGKPGSKIYVMSDFGEATTKVNDKGKWEVKVFFSSAPQGKTFPVKVKDEFGSHKKFEFTWTD